MKTNLLITTALVAMVSASNVYAADIVISHDITNQTNTELNNSGALLVNYGEKVTINDNINITNNTSTKGAAGGIKALDGFTAGNGLDVSGNKSEAKMGGGIYVRLVDDTDYANNGFTATNRNVVIGDNATISNNSSKWLGGGMAIESAEKITIGDGATFEANHSDAEGGAIAIWSDASNKLNGAAFDNKTLLELGQTKFIKNTSGSNGGAIANLDGNTIKFVSGSNFEGNIAQADGGAIYNDTDSNIEFSGNNIFSDNKANDKLNDIHNIGDINVADGSLTIDGGISGDGTLTFAEGTNLNVKTNTTTISNNVVNNGANLGLTFANGYAGGEYALITDGGTLDNEFNIAENGIYKIETDSDNKGTYNISKKSTGEISASTGANANQAGAANAITNGNSGQAAFDNVANNISNLLQSSNSSDVAAGLKMVDQMSTDTSSSAQTTTSQTATQVFNAVGTRLSGGSVAGAMQGKSSGDSTAEGGALWAQGLVSKAELDGANGFDADTNGIAFGAEKQITDTTKAGIGYAYSKTDIDSASRTTDVDTHTAIVYGEYKPSNWFVNGIATYGWGSYDESNAVKKASYDVDSFGLQAMTGYDIETNGMMLTPETGLRYVNIKQKAYTDSLGSKIGANSSDILTGVAGLKVSKEFTMNNGMTLKPEARAALTYDLSNDDANSVVTLANGSSYTTNGEALDEFGQEIGLGLTAGINENVDVSLGYEGRFRQDYSDHSGLLNAKYKF